MGRKKKVKIEQPEFESQFSRVAEFDNEDIVKEIREEVKEAFPDLKVKIRLSKKSSDMDTITFKFEDTVFPSPEIMSQLKQIAKEHQQMHYKVCKSYSQWEANFKIVFKVKELEEDESMEEYE